MGDFNGSQHKFRRSIDNFCYMESPITWKSGTKNGEVQGALDAIISNCALSNATTTKNLLSDHYLLQCDVEPQVCYTIKKIISKAGIIEQAPSTPPEG